MIGAGGIPVIVGAVVDLPRGFGGPQDGCQIDEIDRAVARQRGDDLIGGGEPAARQALGQMFGIDLSLIRDDDEDEFDAAGRQPVALALQCRDPARDLRLAQKLQPGILVDLAVEIGIEPVVAPGDHALSRRQSEGEAEAVGGRDQSGAQAEAIGEIGIELAGQARQDPSEVGKRGRTTRSRISSRAVDWPMPRIWSAAGVTRSSAKSATSSRSGNLRRKGAGAAPTAITGRPGAAAARSRGAARSHR